MTTVVLTLVLAAGLVFQAADARQPIRLGPTGDRLSADDVAQITRLTTKAGGAPWVLVGAAPGMLWSAGWFVDVYLQPDRTKSAVRRGRIQSVTAALPSAKAYDSAKTWESAGQAQYAQVPPPGSNADAIPNGRDLSRPFRIVGAFTDEELLSLVSLLRRSPATPSPPTGARAAPVSRIFATVAGDWPIGHMVRQGTASVQVWLIGTSPAEKTWQLVMLHGAGTVWTVDRVSPVIAD